MKKIFFAFLVLFVFSFEADAFNALQENMMHKNELAKLSSKQQIENKKNILYYKGKSSYLGTSNWATSNVSISKKNLYVKKGVKFKVNEELQAQKIKELQEKEKSKTVEPQLKIEDKQDDKIKNTANSPQDVAPKSDNHNADAE